MMRMMGKATRRLAPVSDHQPLTDEEMEAELDQAETDEAQLDK